jgi:mono/diheme cytochrome c family protein
VETRTRKTALRGVLLLGIGLVLGLLGAGCGTDQGADLYASECARCHGNDRAGVEGVGPNLGIESFALEESDEWLADRIGHGYRDMPRFGTTLSETQIARIVSFLRNDGATPGDDLPAPATSQAPLPDDEVVMQGKALYDAAPNGCASCHAGDGAGSADGPNILGASKSGIAAAHADIPDLDYDLNEEELEAVYRYVVYLADQR